MVYSEENEVYSIQTFNLTKRFPKKKRKGILGFLRKKRKKKNRKSKHSDVVTALDHVNVKILSGELFGLLGPNGAGKTTLVKYPTGFTWSNIKAGLRAIWECNIKA